MVTLISVGNSSGETGRCDERCYDAIGEDCQCCCQGQNHGKGLVVATEQTREHALEWLASAREAYRATQGNAQLRLF
jgi:hypothetical protein